MTYSLKQQAIIRITLSISIVEAAESIPDSQIKREEFAKCVNSTKYNKLCTELTHVRSDVFIKVLYRLGEVFYAAYVYASFTGHDELVQRMTEPKGYDLYLIENFID